MMGKKKKKDNRYKVRNTENRVTEWPSKEELFKNFNLVKHTRLETEKNRTDPSRWELYNDYRFSFFDLQYFRDNSGMRAFMLEHANELYQFTVEFFERVLGYADQRDNRWDLTLEHYLFDYEDREPKLSPEDHVDLDKVKERLKKYYNYEGPVFPEMAVMSLLQRLWDHVNGDKPKNS